MQKFCTFMKIKFTSRIIGTIFINRTKMFYSKNTGAKEKNEKKV